MKEIIVIEGSEQSLKSVKFKEKIKDLLDKLDINYQMYQLQTELTEKEKSKPYWELSKEDENDWCQAVKAASLDEQRNNEIEAWDKIASEIKDK